jgi:hypothetical protein
VCEQERNSALFLQISTKPVLLYRAAVATTSNSQEPAAARSRARNTPTRPFGGAICATSGCAVF